MKRNLLLYGEKMFNKNLVLIALTSATLYGCSSDPVAVAATRGMNLPANVEIIQDSGATSSNLASVNAAFDDTGTDYANTSAEVFLNTGAWEDPLTMADMLICIVNATGLDKVPNGTYKSMVDMSQCDSAEGGSQEAKVTRFADATSVTSRAGNTSNQLATAYFLDGQDRNNNGLIAEDENQKFIANISMSESASKANPFGVFDFNWNRDDAVSDGASGHYNRGSMSFTNASSTEIGFSFIEQFKNAGESEEYIQWANGVGAKNGASGKVYVNTNESGSEVIYKVNFNSTHANIKSGGSSVCSSLADDAMTTFVYGYNLYNATTGALIDIVAGVEIVYDTDKDKRGYVGSYWDESAGAIKLWMHTEDGFQPDIIYRKSDLGVAIAVNSWDGRTPTISAMTFVAPIEFRDSFTASTPAGVSDTRDNDLVYEGPGQLWGIPWSNSSGSWQPSYNLADGDTLIGRNGDYAGISYKVKRTGAWKTLATISGASDIATHCTTPLPTDTGFSALSTAPTLVAVPETWASKPAVTAAVRVIQGVLQ